MLPPFTGKPHPFVFVVVFKTVTSAKSKSGLRTNRTPAFTKPGMISKGCPLLGICHYGAHALGPGFNTWLPKSLRWLPTNQNAPFICEGMLKTSLWPFEVRSEVIVIPPAKFAATALVD